MHHIKIDPFFRRLFILLFLGVLAYALFLIKAVIAPFVTAFVLAYFLNPLVGKLQRFMPRILAIVTVYLSGLLVVLALSIWLIPKLWQQSILLWEALPALVIWYNDVARVWLMQHINVELFALDVNILSTAAIDFIQKNYQFSDAQGFLKQALSSGASFANGFGMALMIPMLSFYFLIDWRERLTTWQDSLPKPFTKKVTQIAIDCDDTLMNFAKGQLSVMLLLGAIYAVQLELIGLDLGLIIGISAGIASFVPYLGFGIGIVAALLAGIFQFGFDWLYLGLIFGAFMVGQVVESYILQPLLLGNKIGLSPLWVIFAVMAGASLFGFVGMLIALPVSAIINVLFYHAYDTYLASDYYKGSRQPSLWRDDD